MEKVDVKKRAEELYNIINKAQEELEQLKFQQHIEKCKEFLEWLQGFNNVNENTYLKGKLGDEEFQKFISFLTAHLIYINESMDKMQSSFKASGWEEIIRNVLTNDLEKTKLFEKIS